MDGSGLRVLIASTLGGIVAPRFREEFTPGTVTVAANEQQVRAAITEHLRFDVILTDLTWNDTELEYTFDGLDVLDLVDRLGRAAPVLFAAGRTLAPFAPRSPRTTIHQFFGGGRRGETAGRMAGAIAAGQASNYDTLAAAAGCSRNTAIKVADKYLGPLIRERDEHPDHVPLTTQVVYRWCGEHSRYLVSWCRRHGHGDVLTRREP